jgi:hypothetical protein
VNFTSYDNVNQFLVSLNGVLQAPTDSFTVSGSTLTFASNLSTGDVIDFVLVLGNSLDIGTPSDNTVSLAKINDTAKTFFTRDFRNIIINGDMSIAQRGTSTASITSSGYHTLDRFQTQISSLGTWTQSQSTTVPSGQGFATSLKMDCTTADASPSASDELRIRTKFEGQSLQYLKKGTSSAESLTLSFWVRSNKTGTYICELMDNDNSNRHINKSYTISAADTWEKKTITYDGDTTGTLGNDNGASLELSFWLGAGSNYNTGTLATSWQALDQTDRAVGQVNLADSTSNEWYITGVQLEAGTSASDFEFLPVDVNKNRCLRYFQNVDGAINAHQIADTSQAIFYFALQSPMRANPSATITNTTANFGTFGGNNDASSPSILSNKCTTTYGSLEYEHGVAFASSSGENQILIYNDHGTTFFTLSSEL